MARRPRSHGSRRAQPAATLARVIRETTKRLSSHGVGTLDGYERELLRALGNATPMQRRALLNAVRYGIVFACASMLTREDCPTEPLALTPDDLAIAVGAVLYDEGEHYRPLARSPLPLIGRCTARMRELTERLGAPLNWPAVETGARLALASLCHTVATRSVFDTLQVPAPSDSSPSRFH